MLALAPLRASQADEKLTPSRVSSVSAPNFAISIAELSPGGMSNPAQLALGIYAYGRRPRH